MKTFNEIKPLSNFDIIDYCKKLKISNFIGVFMRDELNFIFKDNTCLVLNSDISTGKGIHWMALFSKNGVSYYFDSYGLQPPNEVLIYCKNEKRLYSEYQIQLDDKIEILCGHYCVYVLYKLYSGNDFDSILQELLHYGDLKDIFLKKRNFYNK